MVSAFKSCAKNLIYSLNLPLIFSAFNLSNIKCHDSDLGNYVRSAIFKSAFVKNKILDRNKIKVKGDTLHSTNNHETFFFHGI